MKICSVRSYLAYPGSKKRWAFVRVETEDGLHGWGEAYTQGGREDVVAFYIEAMGKQLLGRDARDIRHFTTVMKADFGHNRGSLEFFSAMSAIEQALWDLAGKRLNVPVYELLGGRVRDQVRVYANGWTDRSHHRDPADIARKAKEQVALGFSAMKFDPFEEPVRAYVDRAQEDLAVETVRAVRETVGPAVDLMVEIHRRLSPVPALRVARRIEQYDPYWYEEPVPPANLESMLEVKSGTTIPLVAGESLYGASEFNRLLESRAADIINPDVCNTGGILELMDIAAAARARLIGVAPHNFNSPTVALAASLHCALAMPNLVILEYFSNWRDVGLSICPNAPVPEEGFIKAPTGPGLGVDLDIDALQALGDKEHVPIRLTEVSEENGGA